MEHTHFHTNINSGFDRAPYKRHIYSKVDPRGRMNMEPMMQQQRIQWEEKSKAQWDLEKYSRQLNQLQVQEVRRQQLQNQSSQTEHQDFDQQMQDSTQPQI